MANPSAASPEPPGLAARRIAADLLDGVLRRRRPLDEQLDGATVHPGLAALPERDRALTRALVATALRRLGSLRHLLGGFLERGFPADAPRVETALLIGAAQILMLDVPDHAAVDLAVRLVRADRRAPPHNGPPHTGPPRGAKEGAPSPPRVDAPPPHTPPSLMNPRGAHYRPPVAPPLAPAPA